MKSIFNILAVRVLKNCESYIKRILKENTTYFFMNEYVYDNESDWVKLKDRAKLLDNNFYSMNEHNHLSINISAIVGQNGDGKSSIIELILRILNNFAYASGFSFQRDDLVPVKGVWAELFYRVNQNKYSIKCEDQFVFFRCNGECIKKFSIEEPCHQNCEFLKKHSSALFYSLVSNYSLYAYNPKDLLNEYAINGKCWIEGIFHKNDGYQTPIVLNPFRSKGNIDVNAENSLSRQRLLAMFVDKSITEIKTNERPKGFAYKLEEESKLISKTLREYMKRDHYLLEGSFLAHFDELVKLPIQNEMERLDKLQRFWFLIDDCMDTENILLKKTYEIYSRIQESKAPKGIILTNVKRQVSLGIYIANIRNKKFLSKELESIISKFTAFKYEQLDYTAIHRVLLIHEFQEFWNEKFKELGILPRLNEEILNEVSVIGHAYFYVIYKSIEILETYTVQYGGDLNQLTIGMFLNGTQNYLDVQEKLYNVFSKLYNDICESKSHITLKIRQTLNFILLNTKYHYLNVSPDKNRALYSLLGADFSNYIDFDAYNMNLSKILLDNKNLKIIDLLPPPIFDIEIIISRRNESVLFSTLSSGERQLLNSLSQIAYHLRNIDSCLVTDDTINYEFVNLIFEEIELYFHPEFQQKYILSLLEILSKMKFQRLKGVNMCFVTHSPFILSDIPKKNVLFLKEGEPSFPMQEDTFGANIHTLLHNGFFLSNVPIGAFAQAKINSLFEVLHKGEITDNIYNEIMLVSEPFLKSQLLKLYKQNVGDYRNEIRELKQEIEELRKRIDLLK